VLVFLLGRSCGQRPNQALRPCWTSPGSSSSWCWQGCVFPCAGCAGFSAQRPLGKGCCRMFWVQLYI
jgi:hypothetical protein